MFLNQTRAYNALALASLGCNEIVAPGYSPTFKIQGKLYHRIGSLLPSNSEESPKFAQLYFHDSSQNQLQLTITDSSQNQLQLTITDSSQNQLQLTITDSSQNRLHHAQLNPKIVQILHEELHSCNSHIRSFKAAIELDTRENLTDG